jgi:glyoxylase-like metal-dependent hydrolase (beta-lactamase superfamily II)
LIIAEGIATLELTLNALGNPSAIHPTLIWDKDTVVLVDTGTAGQLERIRAGMAEAGVSFNKLNTLILTHQDFDHVGGAPEIVAAAALPVLVLAHEDDKPYIEGDIPYIKFNRTRFAPFIAKAPEDIRRNLELLLDNPPLTKISRTVVDGEVLPYAGGLTVIFTPGHTPGHISLFHHASKTLLAADAMNVVDGKLTGPNPNATPDLAMALKSLAKFAPFEVETIVCYHGGVLQGDAQEQLSALIAAHS